MRLRVLSILLGLLAWQVLSQSAARADELNWDVRNNYGATVHLEFYSGDRQWRWPSGNNVYVLYPGQLYTMRLNCSTGQYICYAAWPAGDTSRFWGLGPRGRQGCEKCCATCGSGDPPIINLY